MNLGILAPCAITRIVQIGRGPHAARFGQSLPLALIAGPCQMESRAHALEVAAALKEIAARRGIGLVYKSSFDKANRTSGAGARGLGLEASLPVFAEIRETLGLPVLTDVHENDQCAKLAEVVDVLQIPAFLCRQTDLLVAAARTGRVVNVKKGQFLAPWDMKNVVAKLDSAGAADILVTERGVSFGYNTLVSDMRALPIMARETGAPVIFDATHSVQQPGGQGASSGGQREFVAVLARAAVAIGVAGVFIETHPDPDHAPSDGPNMVALKDFEALVTELQAFDALAKQPREQAAVTKLTAIRHVVFASRIYPNPYGRLPLQLCGGERSASQALSDPSGRTGDRAAQAEAALRRQPAQPARPTRASGRPPCVRSRSTCAMMPTRSRRSRSPGRSWLSPIILTACSTAS